MKKIDFYIGTCVVENESLTLQVAESLQRSLACFSERIQLTYKGSFDKANRTSLDSFRGLGMEEGLRILEKVKTTLGLPVMTDFHESTQAEAVASVVDVMQIPAFLCRQTDLVVAGARACSRHAGRLNIKKGQFLAPWDVEHIIAKAQVHLPLDRMMLTERGTCFGYNNLVVDMASFKIMESFGVQPVHDCTHCVQRPGGLGKNSGGKREHIQTLARAAAAAGARGFFMECHPDPARALSDASTSLPLEDVAPLVKSVLRVMEAVEEERENVHVL